MPVLDQIASLIAPFDCLICGSEGQLICTECLPKAIITKRLTCYRCNRLSDGGRTCISCRSSSKLAGVTVASHYDGAIKELIYALKYQRAQAAAKLCAELITPLLDPLQFDIVIPVPTSPTRGRQRGYNQAALIARAVSEKLGLPYSESLVRLQDVHQVGLAKLERLKQVEGIFAVYKSASDQRVLLVDDVITTGATMVECAKVLKAAGAKRVWGAAVAKH